MKKKVLILFVVFGVLVLTGCGNDKKGIFGKWETENGEYKYTFNEDGTCDYVILDFHTSCTYIHDIENKSLTINLLSTYNDSIYDTEIINYTLNDDVLDVKISSSLGTVTGTFYRK